MKRILDIMVSILLILLLSPLFMLIGMVVIIGSGFPVFFIQQRVGHRGKEFGLIKFRTMRLNGEKLGFLTIGSHDPRVTRVGYWLRKFKIDELPQLLNVLIGDMSLVGPRPEVMKYVEMYDPRQLRVLTVKPGITDWASLAYFEENDMLATAQNPESFYIQRIMPAKLERNLQYIDNQSLVGDFTIMVLTVKKMLSI